MTPSTLVFVYGTLRSGGSNHFRMAGADFVANATVHGTLYQASWYPGLVRDPGGIPVFGEIFRVSPSHLNALDEYEGPEYHRVPTTALSTQGQTFEVEVWEWIMPVDGLKKIPSGDWLRAIGDA